MQWIYGLVLESYDITPKIELTGFGLKKRRRNRRIQLEGRRFTAHRDKASDCGSSYFFRILIVLPGVKHRNIYIGDIMIVLPGV